MKCLIENCQQKAERRLSSPFCLHHLKIHEEKCIKEGLLTRYTNTREEIKEWLNRGITDENKMKWINDQIEKLGEGELGIIPIDTGRDTMRLYLKTPWTRINYRDKNGGYSSVAFGYCGIKEADGTLLLYLDIDDYPVVEAVRRDFKNNGRCMIEVERQMERELLQIMSDMGR